jgi:hypothetical protein
MSPDTEDKGGDGYDFGIGRVERDCPLSHLVHICD